jgi:hypothetical protein
MTLPGTLHNRRIAEKTGDSSSIKRGGHDQDAEIVTQVPLDVERECESKVGMDTPLVEFIEDDERHLREVWSFVQHPCEDSLRDDLNPCRRPGLTIATSPVSDSHAGAFTALCRHEVRGPSGCKAAGFEYDDAPFVQPRFLQKGQGNLCGLPCTGRSDEDNALRCGECLAESRQRAVNGK